MGSSGNMGRRYMAILKLLGIRHDGYDLGGDLDTGAQYSHIVIATPTTTHIQVIKDCLEVWPKAFILCEKPVSKDIFEILSLKRSYNVSKLFMVNNYAYMLSMNPIRVGTDETRYNYFKTGGDGLFWDCIQLIYMAKGSIELKAEAPHWKVHLNGLELTSNMVDFSYIDMIADFTGARQHCWGFDDIIKAHEAVIKELVSQK